MRLLYAGLGLCVALLCGFWIFSREDAHSALVRQANGEALLRIYGNADAAVVAPLIAAFEDRYPGISVAYEDLDARDIHGRFLEEDEAGRPVADLVWSSAMDLQAKLINDGHALTYVSREAEALPEAANWAYRAYGVTAEPVGLVYNKALIPPHRLPRTHADLVALLQDPMADLDGKVVTYDPSRSNLGYLLLTQDMAITRDTQSLIAAMGGRKPVLENATSPMIDAVSQGRAAIAYNVLLPYAQLRAANDPKIGVLALEDYSLIVSRVIFINRQAPHPAAAKLFLDFVLSMEGQALLARQGLPPIRADVAKADALVPHPRPIPGGPQLFVNLDPIKRQRVLAQWDDLMSDGT